MNEPTGLLKAPFRALYSHEADELARLLALGLSVRAVQRRLLHMVTDPKGYAGRRRA